MRAIFFFSAFLFRIIEAAVGVTCWGCPWVYLPCSPAAGCRPPATVLENFSSTYDAAGQLTTELDNGTSTGFSYDADGQLTGNGGQSLSYDKTGNRTNTGYATGTGNQILSDPTWNYQYDNEGNITQKTNRSTGTYWTYAYDNKNELTSAKKYASGGSLQEEVDFKYDVFGNRIEKDVTQSGTTTVERYGQEWTGEGSPPTGVSTDNANWNVFADLNGSSSLTTRYLRGDAVDQLFARIGSDGSSYWELAGHLGSITSQHRNHIQVQCKQLCGDTRETVVAHERRVAAILGRSGHI